MAFQDILGNRRAKTILAKALQMGRLPNSLLFVGPEGVGKGEVALVVAKALNCQKKTDDSCETCPSCLAINNGNFPDVMTFDPEDGSHKIDQMRILKSAAYLKPMIGKKRVFIIARAEKMRDEASNSLLKILEEPPSFSHILLLTHNPYLILPTIQSRCQTLTFSPVFKEDIEKVLLEKGYTAEKARTISLLVRGNLMMALNLDWEEVQEKREKAWQLFVSLVKGEKFSPKVRELLSRQMQKADREQIFEILASFCRDVLLIIEDGDSQDMMNPDYDRKILEASRSLTREQSLDFLRKIDYSLYAIQKNLNINLLMSSFFSHFMEDHHG